MPTNDPPETHPWKYHIPPLAHALVIGTFPTAAKNRSFDFFYPNKRNLFWKVMADLAGSSLPAFEAPLAAVRLRKEILDGLNVGITDMGYRVRRKDDASTDEKLEMIEPMPIIDLLKLYPTIQTIVLTSTTGRVSAARWLTHYLKEQDFNIRMPKGRKPLSFAMELAGRKVTVWLLHSPSPRAANRIPFVDLCQMYKHVLVR